MVNISLDITRERRLEERVRLLKEASNESAVTRILIIENEPAKAQTLQLFFTRAGCVVDVVTNVAHVFKQVEKEHYSLIFMDIHLTDDKGVKVAKTIRSRPGKNQGTPIIGFNECQ